MDERLLEISALREEEDRAFYIEMARQKTPTPHGWDGVHCVDCEDEIPPSRRNSDLLGWFRCVQCQTDVEASDKKHPRFSFSRPQFSS